MAAENLLSQVKIVNVDYSIAQIGGWYKSQYKIKLPDALIAATAKSYDLPLWTYNLKDFQKIKGLRVTEPKI